MLSESQRRKPFSKKASFQISKFGYQLQHTIPQLFSPESSLHHSPTNLFQRFKGHKGKIVYEYVTHCVDGVGSLDEEAIMEAAKKLYYSKDSIRINRLTFSRKRTYNLSFLPIEGQFKEIIELALIDHNKKSESIIQSQIEVSSHQKIKDGETQTPQPKPFLPLPLNNFELFVVHHCDGEGMRWEQFIEKYHFLDQNLGENGSVSSKIHYSLLFTYQEEEGLLNFLSQKNTLFDKFLAGYLEEQNNTLKNLEKIQGFLLLSKVRVDKKLRELSDASFQESHKRWLRLPTEYFKEFTCLKKHTMSFYNSIHEQKHHNDVFLNNLICRYMFAKEYNYKQALEGVLEYLKWEKTLASTYNLTMFEHYHKKDFFSYLGKDFEGRAVVLNRAAHINFSVIQDAEDYCNYYIYFLEIWIQKKLKGYADQYTVLADLQGLSTEHFKLAITKRNIGDSLKYSPQRQYKLLVVNASTFAKMIWRVLKPLLPKKTLQKLNIVGSEREEIIEQLSKEMDISVIPEYLGGQNTRTCADDLDEQIEMLKGQEKQREQI